jgi:hypothetical protein
METKLIYHYNFAWFSIVTMETKLIYHCNFAWFSIVTMETKLIYHCNYTPRNEVVGGYTGFTMSVRPSVDKSYVVR